MGEHSRARRPYRHVACCVDESDAAAAAMEEAARVWRLGGGPEDGRLSAVHALREAGAYTGGRGAWSPPPEEEAAGLQEEARGWLDGLAARHAAEAVLLADARDPARDVLRWAVAEGCDLLVAAPRRGALARAAFLGSFASALVRDAPCPVLLVGRRAVPEAA